MAEEITPAQTPTPEPEPEGVVEVQGQKFVPVSALVAERTRARDATEERLRKEFEPLKEKAAKTDQLAADLDALRPQLDYLREHPELFEPKPDAGPQISDEEAEKYARRFELYTPTGLDLKRAKHIIADNRTEMARVAHEAAQQAVQPALQATAQQVSRQNFIWAAQQHGVDGRALVDPAVLAAEWAKLPAELTARPEVAQHVLKAAIGEFAMSGKRQPAADDREPVFTEVPGGGHGQTYRISDTERKLARTAGLSEQQWSDSAKQYQPDRLNVLGD